MTEPVCVLEEFYLTRLKVQWFEPEEPIEVDTRFGFNYDVAYSQDDPNRYRLTFRVTCEPGTQPKVGYEIDSEMMGFFSFPEDTPREEMEYLIRLNGSTILYGILRGELASVTGMFPHGKFVLPTVMMSDVVEAVEKERAEKSAAPHEQDSKDVRKKSKQTTRSTGAGRKSN